MKKQLRKAMICTVAMMLVAVLTLTGVTYAWFSESATATASGIDIAVVESNGGVLMSAIPNPSSWAYKLDLGVGVKDFRPASTAPENMQTDGTLKFFDGVIDETDNGKIFTSEIATAMASTYYVKKDIYFYNDSTTEDMVVVLDPISTSAGTALTSIAMRLAIVDYGDYEKGTDGTVYVPGTSNVKVPTANDVKIFEFDADTHLAGNTNVEDTYPVKGASGATSFNVDEHEGFVSDGIDDTNSEYLTYVETYHAANPKNISFTVAKDTCHKITVYIWLEGQDVDCTNDVAGYTMENIAIAFTRAS